MEKISASETWRRIKMDVELFAKYTRIGKLTWLKWLSCFLTPSVFSTFIYRISRYFFVRGWKKTGRLFYTLNLILFGVDFGMISDIGGGLYIPHPVGLVIYGKLGENIFITQGVGIGGGMSSSKDIGAGPGFPVIENNAFLSVKTTIAGPIRIGKSSLISAHSLVLTDIPDSVIAAGTPAKVKRTLVPGELERLTNLPYTPERVND